MAEDDLVKGDSDDVPYFGFILAFVFSVIGLVLYFGWNSIGPEIVVKTIGMVCILIAVSGFGTEISEKSKNDGALNLAIGLAFSLSILMLQDIYDLPNWSLLIISFFALLFISISFVQLINFNKKVPITNRIDSSKIEKDDSSLLKDDSSLSKEENSQSNVKKRTFKSSLSDFHSFIIGLGKFAASILSVSALVKFFMDFF